MTTTDISTRRPPLVTTPGRDKARPLEREPGSVRGVLPQLKLSPQAQELPALGLSIVKPCFSMVSTKSIVAPSR